MHEDNNILDREAMAAARNERSKGHVSKQTTARHWLIKREDNSSCYNGSHRLPVTLLFLDQQIDAFRFVVTMKIN